MPTIKELIEAKALFVANHSGGKDSMATLIELLKVVPKEQLLVVHASLGIAEWPGALEKAQEHALAHGLAFRVARANKTLFEMVERRFKKRPGVPSWPSASTRQCTSDLKRDPIAKAVRGYATEHGYSIIVNCLGIRAQESVSRAKREVWSVNTRETNAKRSWYEYLPIHGLSTKDVFELIATQELKPHYAYMLGNERLSCVFCIMSSRNDLIIGQRHNSDLFNQYLGLEAKTGYTMHMSRNSLQELVFGTNFSGQLAA